MSATIGLLRDELAACCERIDRPLQLMEVCGTHTVSLFRSGVRSLLPASLRMVSGPGCPVCVTAQRHIDAAIELAQRDGVLIATYGDMLRVPGRAGSLERLRALGARVLVVNSARTALQAAREDRGTDVVFLAVGFETTAPATAAVLLEAERGGDENFSVMTSHKRVVPAMLALLTAGEVPLDGFLCPGHVSVIIGAEAYRPIVERHRKPCVVAGFEPEQMMRGILALARQVESGRAALENVYRGVVSDDGNRVAQALMRRVFVAADTPWRALGTLRESGLDLSPAYRRFDAMRRFGVHVGEDVDDPECRCGEVIQGKVEPAECPLFATRCTPLTPIGPCMVSSEGTCAAWHRFERGARSRRAARFPQEVLR